MCVYGDPLLVQLRGPLSVLIFFFFFLPPLGPDEHEGEGFASGDREENGGVEIEKVLSPCFL